MRESRWRWRQNHPPVEITQQPKLRLGRSTLTSVSTNASLRLVSATQRESSSLCIIQADFRIRPSDSSRQLPFQHLQMDLFVGRPRRQSKSRVNPASMGCRAAIKIGNGQHLAHQRKLNSREVRMAGQTSHVRGSNPKRAEGWSSRGYFFWGRYAVDGARPVSLAPPAADLRHPREEPRSYATPAFVIHLIRHEVLCHRVV